MSTGRFVAPGRTRSCPHCKATILESAAVCPGCHHHLRFDSVSGQRAQTADTPLRVDGILRHTADGGAWEYSIVLAIRNGRGEEVSRQVVGVGALLPAEERTFSLAVEVFKPAEASKSAEVGKPADAGKPAEAPKPQAATAATAARATAAAAGTHAAETHAAPTASSATAPRPSDPRAPAPGRMAPPGSGRDPARPPVGFPRDSRMPGSDPRLPAGGAAAQPARSGGLVDPRAAARDPKPYPKRP